jgi:leader peptidase (prepilin peptidase)/N-methyltransferase
VSLLRQEVPPAVVSPSPATEALRGHCSATPALRAKRSNTLATAAIALTALAAALASVAAAPDLRGLMGGALALLMLAVAAIDARRFVIPNELCAAALGLALAHAAIQEPHAVFAAIAEAVLRGAVLALIFLALRELYRRLRGREGLGLGDVKLAGAGGAWLGWSMIPIAVEIAALGALAYYGVRHFAGARPLRATSRIPFGLFLAPAIWLGWLLETLLSTV